MASGETYQVQRSEFLVTDDRAKCSKAVQELCLRYEQMKSKPTLHDVMKDMEGLDEMMITCQAPLPEQCKWLTAIANHPCMVPDNALNAEVQVNALLQYLSSPRCWVRGLACSLLRVFSASLNSNGQHIGAQGEYQVLKKGLAYQSCLPSRYTHTHTHTHTHTLTHTHTHANTTHTRAHTHAHTHKCTHTQMHIHTHIRTHMQTHTPHTHKHTQTHTCTNTHKHKHHPHTTHTHKHTPHTNTPHTRTPHDLNLARSW